MLMSAPDYRESLRAYRPVVYVDGRRVELVERHDGVDEDALFEKVSPEFEARHHIADDHGNDG